MATARQWISEDSPVATDMHATLEELLDTVFSMWSMPRLYSKDHRETEHCADEGQQQFNRKTVS
jgi:hypothetical protein